MRAKSSKIKYFHEYRTISLQNVHFCFFRQLIFSGFTFIQVRCRDKANCPHVEPWPMGGVPSVGVFVRDPYPYLPEFRRKPRKTPKGLVDKRDQESNVAPPVYQF